MIIPPIRPIPLPLPIITHLPPLAIQAVFFIALLVLASAIDIRKRIIPNTICAAIALTGLISFSPVNLFGILTALPLLIAAVCKQDSIGGGDVKLAGAAGFVLGFGGGIAGLIVGLAAMLLYHAGKSVVRRLRRDKDRKENERASLPMAPFLSIGFTAAYILTFAL